MGAKAICEAVDAAVSSGELAHAFELLGAQPPQGRSTQQGYEKLGMHCEGNRQFNKAEECFLKAGLPKAVVKMYKQQITDVYVEQGSQREALGEFECAERLYLDAQEPDLAIRMYKTAKQWDGLTRVVSQHKCDFLHRTHFAVANILAKEKDYKQAEHHFIQSTTGGSVDGWD
eukprot:gene56793-biopygen64719